MKERLSFPGHLPQPTTAAIRILPQLTSDAKLLFLSAEDGVLHTRATVF